MPQNNQQTFNDPSMQQNTPYDQPRLPYPPYQGQPLTNQQPWPAQPEPPRARHSTGGHTGQNNHPNRQSGSFDKFAVDYHDNDSPLLPKPVEAARAGWAATVQAAAVVAALFAAVESQLLPGATDLPDTRIKTVLHAVSYAGLALNLSATLSAMIMLDILGELPTRSWRDPQYQSHPTINDSDDKMLRTHGADFRYTMTVIHFTVSVVLGVSCLGIQIGLLAYIRAESRLVHILVWVFVSWGFIPLFFYLFFSFGVGLFKKQP